MTPASVFAVKITNVSFNGTEGKAHIQEMSDDQLAVEEPLEISMVYGEEGSRESKNISITMCTPGNEEELATGFLYTEGIIHHVTDILRTSHSALGGIDNKVIVELKPGINFDPKKIERHFYTSSSCGVCGKSSISAVKNVISCVPSEDDIKVKASILIGLPEILRKEQEVFARTGGLHASALFDSGGNLILTREDVGRHNALDKLVGAGLASNMLPFDHLILLLSGRASFELIQKAAMAGIRIVCAVGAPSSLAVEMANECGITLVGFLRDNRFNIYTGPERILH
jgi:FdhD protein